MYGFPGHTQRERKRKRQCEREREICNSITVNILYSNAKSETPLKGNIGFE